MIGWEPIEGGVGASQLGKTFFPDATATDPTREISLEKLKKNGNNALN